MRQTSQQRRDAARRLEITGPLSRTRDLHVHLLIVQICEALDVLSGDELELVELLAGCIERESDISWDSPRAIRALAGVVARMLRGRSSYGELSIDTDPRSYRAELDEELADAVIYDRLALLREVRQMGESSVAALHLHLDSLARVGERSDLAQLMLNVQDRERPEPFTIPPPWCLGSGLLFQHGAVRIANGAIVAVRCHQCGREWPLYSNELRLTGSGQYVIPTHEPAPDWRSLPPAESKR